MTLSWMFFLPFFNLFKGVKDVSNYQYQPYLLYLLENTFDRKRISANPIRNPNPNPNSNPDPKAQ